MPNKRGKRSRSRKKEKVASADVLRRPWHVHALKWTVLVGGTLALALGIFYAALASRYDLSLVQQIPERSAVFDMDGAFYARLSGENRIITDYNGIAPAFLNALLAREDSRFYRHLGVDPIGISRAVFANLTHGRVRQGGSTLTQQLALNTFLGGRHEHSLHRKLLEAFLAFRIEENFTKRQIIEFYANRIYFGSGVYGIETASQTYFGIPAAKLNLCQSAMLAGMIRSPNRYSPFNNFDGCLKQRDSVLKRMTELGMITDGQRMEAEALKPTLAKRRPAGAQDNYAMDTVRGDLDVILSDEQMDDGGLKIYTTLDPILQQTAEQAIDKRLTEVEQRDGYPHPTRAQFHPETEGEDTPYLQGSVIAIDNRTGGIRAIAGGRNYAESRYNRAVLTSRQVGSTFKPFVYAAAFSKGMSPDKPIDDGPIHAGEISGGGAWRPENSDGTFRGLQPAAEGLIHSRNTMSVRVGQIAGLNEVREIGRAAGFPNIPAQPAIFLGSFEATLKQMTAAYTIFPNLGLRRQPYIIERVEDGDGKVLYRAAKVQAKALDPGVCDEINQTLAAVVERGTAANASDLGLKKEAAGKTGTTNDFRDAWFVGYTKTLTCGVWVGLDKPKTIMPKGYGATLALPVWVDVMNAAAPDKYPAPGFEARKRRNVPASTPAQPPGWLRRLFGH